MVQILKQRIVGEYTKFSIHTLSNGDIRLNITQEGSKTHIDMSGQQWYALDAAINDASQAVNTGEREFLGAEFGDK